MRVRRLARELESPRARRLMRAHADTLSEAWEDKAYRFTKSSTLWTSFWTECLRKDRHTAKLLRNLCETSAKLLQNWRCQKPCAAKRWRCEKPDCEKLVLRKKTCAETHAAKRVQQWLPSWKPSLMAASMAAPGAAPSFRQFVCARARATPQPVHARISELAR